MPFLCLYCSPIEHPYANEARLNFAPLADEIQSMFPETTEAMTATIPECKICLEPYDDYRNRPMSGLCGHSMCSRCVEQCRNTSCPICRHLSAFRIPVPNYALLDIISQPGSAYSSPSATKLKSKVEKCIRDFAEEERRQFESAKKEFEELLSGLQLPIDVRGQ